VPLPGGGFERDPRQNCGTSSPGARDGTICGTQPWNRGTMGMEGVNIPTQDVPRCGPPNLLEISSVRLLPLATSNPWPPKGPNFLAANLGTPAEISYSVLGKNIEKHQWLKADDITHARHKCQKRPAMHSFR